MRLELCTFGHCKGWCGGSLITSKTVLTAAHCTTFFSASQIRVVVGEHDLDDVSDGQEMVTVQEKIEHPDYERISYESDFAMLVLSELVTWRRAVQPICLPGIEAGIFEDVEVLTKLDMFSKHVDVLSDTDLIVNFLPQSILMLINLPGCCIWLGEPRI